MEYQNYNSVPWYRKSSTCKWLVIVGLLIAPLSWVAACLLITGDIFYDKLGVDGNLKKWSKRVRVAAYVIIVFPIVLWLGLIAKNNSLL